MLSWNLTHLDFFCWPLLPKLEPKSVCILQNLLPFLTILGMAWVLKIFKIPSTCLNGSINVTKICGITPALFNTLIEWIINGFYMHTGHSKFAMLEIPWWWWFAINRDLTFWGTVQYYLKRPVINIQTVKFGN